MAGYYFQDYIKVTLMRSNHLQSGSYKSKGQKELKIWLYNLVIIILSKLITFLKKKNL